MARNQEKAQAMLNRFLADKQGKPATKAKRPHLASACSDLNEADRWRQQLLREIGRKVMEIQNAALGEHRCVFAFLGVRATLPTTTPTLSTRLRRRALSFSKLSRLTHASSLPPPTPQ